jgi:DNA-binding LacI/PurR family transcriptional regulator
MIAIERTAAQLLIRTVERPQAKYPQLRQPAELIIRQSTDKDRQSEVVHTVAAVLVVS